MQPNGDQAIQVGPAAREPSAEPPLSIPTLILQAQAAFAQDLPQLLRERPGQWVAYHGGRRVGFAGTDLALYQECLRHGMNEDEILVLCIEPEAGGVRFGPQESR